LDYGWQVLIIYAIITGDVIESEKLKIDYRDRLKRTFKIFQDIYEEYLPLKVDRYAGDQFQILLNAPEKSLECSLFIYSHLASKKPRVVTRLSLVIGNIDNVPKERVSTGKGEVFRLSGTGLDDLLSHQRLNFNIAEDSQKEIISVFQGAFDLLSLPLSDLTPAQAEYISYKLRDFKDKQIKDELDITQQSVHDRKIASDWKNIKPFIDSFEEYFKN